MYDIFLQRFWEIYEPLLAGTRTQGNLTAISKDLCKNTMQYPTNGLAVPRSSAEFIDSFSGTKSRWDMLGTFFIVLGFVAVCLPSTDPLLEELIPEKTTPKDFGANMLEVADACLALSDELDEQSNLLSLLLMYKCVCFQSVVGGDTSYSLWKRLGSLTAAVTAFGLHKQQPPCEKPYSLLYVQLQKRIFSSVFGMTCVLGTFHGRPPGLSRHYLSGDLPLDASEEDLLTDDEEMIRRSLCSGGWNLTGKIHPSTMGRAFLVANLIREEVLEICLGRQVPDTLNARIASVRQKIEQDFADLPGGYCTVIMRFITDWSRSIAYALNEGHSRAERRLGHCLRCSSAAAMDSP